MEQIITPEGTLLEEIQAWLRGRLFPLFEKYHLDLEDLEATIKWKPVVLLLGNYSSGKSTLINELLGKEIQRTGQAPTDDSFTVITAPGPEAAEQEIPGSTLVNDRNLPFASLKAYGAQFIAHFQMKLVHSPLLENLAIIDSPGMLDSVTEKGRGYDFPKVIGTLARLADLVVLMFDPHKAGTIKETYTTIRNTLPETSGEDRVAFVMSRIDECDNLGDMVRSYGTLCWNLSQMTGRKDIPRIFLTFSNQAGHSSEALAVWVDERNQLVHKILSTPKLRISHILHTVDKQLNELKMVIEAMAGFTRGAGKLLRKTIKWTLGVSLLAFFLIDFATQKVLGYPPETLVNALLGGHATLRQLLVPLAGAAVVLIFMGVWFFKWRLRRYRKRCRQNPEQLIELDTAYRQNTWAKTRPTVLGLLSAGGVK
ncbi:MAG: dynamin family protein, partial [Desulfobacterales bacterium]|nr:dynamin family protein [Desulfobacterales bacterium]